jgi:hypothetical protein
MDQTLGLPYISLERFREILDVTYRVPLILPRPPHPADMKEPPAHVHAQLLQFASLPPPGGPPLLTDRN